MATKTARKTKPRISRSARNSTETPRSATTRDAKRRGAGGKFVSCEAFLRDLPTLVADAAIQNRWVLYVGDRRGEVTDTKRELIRQCNVRGLSPSEYFIGYVDHYTAQDFESAEIEVIGESIEESDPSRRESAR